MVTVPDGRTAGKSTGCCQAGEGFDLPGRLSQSTRRRQASGLSALSFLASPMQRPGKPRRAVV